MDFVPAAKQKEVRHGLERIGTTILVVYGPAGSSKTHTVGKIASSMGLCIEYMEDVELYKNSFLTKNTVCMVDMDDHSMFMKHRERLAKMRNLVIETRMLPFIGRMLPNSTTVNFNRITNTKLRKFYGLSENELGRIEGNLHAVRFHKYSAGSGAMSIYHQLGRIFYSRDEDVGRIVSRIESYGLSRFVGYLDENCVFFMEMNDISRLFEMFSLCTLSSKGFVECMVDTLLSARKRKVEGFFSFKSFKSIESRHQCSKICRNR